MPGIVFIAFVLFAAPVTAADTILYATAATPGRVDGFCVGRDGSLAGAATVQVATAGKEPRRLVVGADGVLYVGEVDRVEAFTIGPHGGLKAVGATHLDTRAINVADMALSENGQLLYVAENGGGRVAAYPLPLGRDTKPTSCIQGDSGALLRAVAVHAGLVYTTQQFPGRVNIFRLNPDGNLPQVPTECTVAGTGKNPRPPATSVSPGAEEAGLARSKLGRLRSIVFDGNTLYVEKVGTGRILQFALQADGTFVPAVQVKKKLEQQKPASRTAHVLWYADLQMFRTTLLGTQFGHGRVDAYRVRGDGRLPKNPTRMTKADVRTTPVRMAISPDGVLYVSAGEFDRIEAFRLRDSDGLPEETPFSMTDEQTGSFPNDVALATPSDGCR